MAPEQIRGKPEFASDLFACGLIGYLLLTGRHPFVDPTGLAAPHERILRNFQIVPPRDINELIPPYAHSVILRLLEHEATARYRSAADAILDLEPPKVLCQKCGTELRSRSRFCDLCSTPVARAEQDERSEGEAGVEDADTISRRGYWKSREGNFEGAIADYREAIRRDPEHGRAYRNLGYALNHLGRYAEAIEALSKAIEIDQVVAEPYKLRSFSHVQLNQLTQAIQDLTRANQIEPTDRDSIFFRAQVYARGRRFQEALRDLNELLSRDPTDEGAIRLRNQLNSRRPSFNPPRLVDPA